MVYRFNMICFLRKSLVTKAILACVAVTFVLSGVSFGQVGVASTINLLPLSQPVSHSVLKGIKVNPDNPFGLEFIIDTNNDKDINKEEAQTLVNYFFAGLTLPEEDLWVNLSPYEQSRIIPDTTATTELGEGLLKEDYLLKQLAASLTYPETELGKKYWDEMNGNSTPYGGRSATNSLSASNALARSSFTKVWITPDKALVCEHGNSAFIAEATLKVQTEEDYLAIQNNGRTHGSAPTDAFKTHILPAIIQQVNEGEHFSQLRQIYNALILGVWFKNKLKDSIYKNYIAQSKTKGIDNADAKAKEKIYRKYLEAFKQGAYNYVKKESVGANDHSPAYKIARRAYFSGGINLPVAAALSPASSAPHFNGKVCILRTAVEVVSGALEHARTLYGDGDKIPSEAAMIEKMISVLSQKTGVNVNNIEVAEALEASGLSADKLPIGKLCITLVDLPRGARGPLGHDEGLNYFIKNPKGKTLETHIVLFTHGGKYPSRGIWAHELREAALRQHYPDKHWTEIHNMACDELGTPELKLTLEQIAQYKNTQNEIGAGIFKEYTDHQAVLSGYVDLVIYQAAKSIADAHISGMALRAVIWGQNDFKIVFMKDGKPFEQAFSYREFNIPAEAYGAVTDSLNDSFDASTDNCKQLAQYLFVRLSQYPPALRQDVMVVMRALQGLVRNAQAYPKPVPARVANAYAEQVSFSEHVEWVAIEALKALLDRVDKRGWHFKSLKIIPSGILITFDGGFIEVPFNKFKAHNTMIPQIAQAFTEQSLREPFLGHPSFDAGNLARYLSNMIKDQSRRQEASVMVDKIVTTVHRARQASQAEAKPPRPQPPPLPKGLTTPKLTYTAQATSGIVAPPTDMPDIVRETLAIMEIPWWRVVDGQAQLIDPQEILNRITVISRNLYPDHNKDKTDQKARAGAFAKLSSGVVTTRRYLHDKMRNSGGAIGRWGYENIIYDSINKTLTLVNPYRIPDASDRVEDEFAQYDQRKHEKRPDIVVNVTAADYNFDANLLGGGVKVLFLEDSGNKANHAGFYRLNGIGDERIPGVIFIRRALWNRCSIDQRRELFGHELLHAQGYSHADAREMQLQAGLTAAIKAQTIADKESYALDYKPVDGGITIKNIIKLQTQGHGADFKITSAADLNYVTLIPRVISVGDLPQAELDAMLGR